MKALIVALLLTLPFGPVLAQSTDEECAIQGALAQAVADQRVEGTRKRRAERLILKGLTERAEKYSGFIPTLVEYVYEQVAEDMLDDSFGATWRDQCLSAK